MTNPCKGISVGSQPSLNARLNQKGVIMDGERMRNIFVAIAVCLTFVLNSGCASTNGGTGMTKHETGGSTAGTLIGACVGAGLIGNEVDRKQAHALQTAIEEDTSPLANTTWQVVSVTPTPVEPMKSKVGRFNPDGTLTTTTTYWDGRTVTDTDS